MAGSFTRPTERSAGDLADPDKWRPGVHTGFIATRKIAACGDPQASLVAGMLNYFDGASAALSGAIISPGRENDMLKKIIMGAAVVAAAALAAPDQSEARGGGWHGGGAWHGGGNWHGGNWHAGKWNNGKWRNGKWYGGYGAYGWGVPAAAVAVGAGAAAAAVAAPYYYNGGGCYRNVQVMTAYGPRWQVANVC
jgi:hypothetical protein